MADPRTLQSPFYRVSSRALILTPDNKLVLVEDETGELQLPGGGWEHDEPFEACIQREIQEELGVGVERISDILFTYRQLDQRAYTALRLVVRVQPDSYNLVAGDDMVNVKLVAKSEFAAIRLCPGEGPVQAFINTIWSEK